MNDELKKLAEQTAHRFVKMYGDDAWIFCARQLRECNRQGLTAQYWSMVGRLIDEAMESRA